VSRARPLATGLLAASALGVAAGAQEPPVVERVEIANNRHIQAETLLFYVSTRAGDRYDEQRLQDDFRRLLDTGFLDDLRLDVTDGEGGKRVVFDVGERRRIRAVEYRGSKALTTAAIEDELKKR
jgi:outer membrane protein assembly factor BamA